MIRYVLASLLIAVGLHHSSTLYAAGAGTVGRSVTTEQQVAIDQINHTDWDVLLRKYCNSQGMVNYRAWHNSKTDLEALDNYLAHLSKANPNRPSNNAAKLAFWINAYNAVTIKGILREYPTTSIRNHTAKIFGYNIWDDLLLQVGNQTFSLNQMEHEILRKMGEPRIHFAIVCASKGCPPLLNQAYTSEILEQQLVFNTNRFFADREKFRYQAGHKRLELSPILKWFAEGFGVGQAAQLRTIAPYLPDLSAQQIAASGQASVSYLSYDWGLNEQEMP